MSTLTAREAYQNGDKGASIAAHNAPAEELHKQAGDRLKSIVYGGLDGIITTFSIVSAANGGALGYFTVLILGFSNIFADAMSMGMSDWLSTKAENEYILKEKEREEWELENNAEGEIEEMIDLYMEKGMERGDAEMIVRKMAKYEDLFIDIMMVQELELQVPDEDDSPACDGVVTFCAFTAFGSVPLLGYLFLGGSGLSNSGLFTVSIVLTLITLFSLGVFKTKFSVQKWYEGGLEILSLGGAAAAISYGIGYFIANVILGGNAAAVTAAGV
jgi:VIT1/CCC1 family predicted Fe2+/Mn2+ transporter